MGGNEMDMGTRSASTAALAVIAAKASSIRATQARYAVTATTIANALLLLRIRCNHLRHYSLLFDHTGSVLPLTLVSPLPLLPVRLLLLLLIQPHLRKPALQCALLHHALSICSLRGHPYLSTSLS